MKCPKCGLENGDGAKFCKSCGSPLDSGPKNQEKSSKNTLIIAVAAIICVCIIAGALIMTSGNNSENNSAPVSDSDEDNSTTEVNTDDSSSKSDDDRDSDRYANFDSREWTESSYTIDDIYTAHTPEDAKAEMFKQADFNGDGVLKGNEIKEMDYLLKHSEYTWNGPGDSSSSSSQKHWYGQCTTHGWVQLDSNQHCPQCIEEGLDPRVLKDSKVYQ